MKKFIRVSPPDVINEIAKGEELWFIDRDSEEVTFGIQKMNCIRVYDALGIIKTVNADKNGRYEIYKTEEIHE